MHGGNVVSRGNKHSVVLTAALAFWVNAVLASGAETISLESLKGKYEEAKNKIEAQCAQTKSDALAQFGKQLDSYSAYLKEKGDLDSFLAEGADTA